MVFCIIRENKIPIYKFDFGNCQLEGKFPLEDGSIILREPIDDSCSICVENFNVNDKIIYWTGCNHPYHFNCYKLMKLEHNILSCPMCRSKIERTHYPKILSYICDNNNYDIKYKYNDVSCFYIDKQNNLNVRYKIFCKKYNFNNNFLIFKNIPVPMLFKLVSLIYQNNIQEISNFLNIILEKFVKNYQIVLDNFKTFSDIFNVNILSFLEDKMNNSIESLVSSNKKTLNRSLETFISMTEGKLWFNTHSLNERKKFYQTRLSKIGGEKYRKVFMAETIKEFIQQIRLFS
jgi:hypothetical protein